MGATQLILFIGVINEKHRTHIIITIIYPVGSSSYIKASGDCLHDWILCLWCSSVSPQGENVLSLRIVRNNFFINTYFVYGALQYRLKVRMCYHRELFVTISSVFD